MHFDVSVHVREARARLKYPTRDDWKRKRETKGRSDRERVGGEMVGAIRRCYLGAGRCVWHNLKLEIAVSIWPHSVATRATDNKSSLILLKISRECSGGRDKDRRGWQRGTRRGQRREGERENVGWVAKQIQKYKLELLEPVQGPMSTFRYKQKKFKPDHQGDFQILCVHWMELLHWAKGRDNRGI